MVLDMGHKGLNNAACSSHGSRLVDKPLDSLRCTDGLQNKDCGRCVHNTESFDMGVVGVFFLEWGLPRLVHSVVGIQNSVNGNHDRSTS